MYKSLNKVIHWALLCSLSALPAAARPPQVSPPDASGTRWATVGNPGNRLPTQAEAPRLYMFGNQPYGRVDTPFRIATTEVTATQWAEFATAFAPYYVGSDWNFDLTGWTIYPTRTSPNKPLTYAPVPGRERAAATMSWNYAARFANWLNNDKRSDRAAFETGVYDVRNFGTHYINGPWTPIPTRAPDARYWIPSIDELTKATFYDPDRYGPSQGGYWEQPNGSNTPLIPGWPEDGGQTDAGIRAPLDFEDRRYPPVGSYPLVMSPYGLLDTSGGVPEITDTIGEGDVLGLSVLGRGTGTYTDPELYVEGDRLDFIGAGEVRYNLFSGLRLASSVPSPATGWLVLMSVSAMTWRRRRGTL